MIIECPQNDLFHDPCDVILTSQASVRELGDDDDDRTLVSPKDPFKSTFFGKITNSNCFYDSKR